MRLAIRETEFTPSVRIFQEDHRIVISGPSRLEDPTQFYQNFTKILEETIINFKSGFLLEFKLNYMNSSSSKWLFHILKNVQNRYGGTKKIMVNWYYDCDDENMLEAGEVFRNLLTIPFSIIEV